MLIFIFFPGVVGTHDVWGRNNIAPSINPRDRTTQKKSFERGKRKQIARGSLKLLYALNVDKINILYGILLLRSYTYNTNI